VLVVDDMATNRFLLEEALGEIDADIFIADSGERALELASATHPEVVLVDFQMPGLNGAETARRIKESGGPFSYVILMSGYRAVEESDAYRRAPVDRFLDRPFGVEELRAAVTEGLTLARERR
jgi:CheY-like chemotaxis protein